MTAPADDRTPTEDEASLQVSVGDVPRAPDAEAPPAPKSDVRALLRGGAFAGAVLVSAGLSVLGIVRGPGAAEGPDAAKATPAPDAQEAAAAVDPFSATPPPPEAKPVVEAAPKPAPIPRVKELGSDPAVEIVEGTFGKFGFLGALTRAGLPRPEIRRVARALEGVRHAVQPSPKDAFVIARDRAKGHVLGFELVASPLEVWQVKPTDEAAAVGELPKLASQKLAFSVEQKPFAAAFVAGPELAKALAAAGLREELVPAIDDALEGHIDGVALRRGARLRLVGHDELVDGAFTRTRLDAVELVPTSGSPLRVYWYEREEGEGSKKRAPLPAFYDEKGRKPYRGAFRSPVPLARITSRFNPRRMHPVLKVIMPHNGVDFGASTGTPVYASAAGTVSQANGSGPCGNMVEIQHAAGVVTAYCHLSKFAAGLSPGQHVEARQLIGYVGQTGRATGPHLHFAAKRGSTFIDPLALKLDGTRVLPPSDREVFQKAREALDVRLDAVALPAADGTTVEEKDEPEDKDLHGAE